MLTYIALVGKDSKTWRGVIGRNKLPDLNRSGVQSLNACARNSLSITLHQDILGGQSMIDFVVASSDLQLYVLDTRVKRGAELSTDHHLVVSWLRWQRSKPDRPGSPKRVVTVCWEHLAEDLVKMIINSYLQKSFNHSLSGPCSALPLSRRLLNLW